MEDLHIVVQVCNVMEGVHHVRLCVLSSFYLKRNSPQLGMSPTQYLSLRMERISRGLAGGRI